MNNKGNMSRSQTCLADEMPAEPSRSQIQSNLATKRAATSAGHRSSHRPASTSIKPWIMVLPGGVSWPFAPTKKLANGRHHIAVIDPRGLDSQNQTATRTAGPRVKCAAKRC